MTHCDRRRPILRTARFRTWAAAILIPILAAACGNEQPDQEPRSDQPQSTALATSPALVVSVVIDQLRPDQLERWDDLFQFGLRRILDDGFHFTDAAYDHAFTGTGPGHAVVSTGVHPYRHGIVVNTWHEETNGLWESVYAIRDTTSPVLGFPDEEGRSPANLLRDGFPDWLKANDPDARIVSLSRKDRAAVIMGGHADADVYWLHPRAGQFVTSAHYRASLPEWVVAFNRDLAASLPSDSVWVQSVPTRARSRTRPDTARYEADGIHTFFPHRFQEQSEEGTPEALARWVAETPAPDRWTIDLALRAIAELGLGSREGGTDYLALALSQIDRVGHRFGPLSREQLDNLLHLDRELGRLFDVLDRDVGEGRWIMAFTSDHGVIEIPEHREEATGEPSRRLSPDDEAELVRVAEAAAEAAGTDPLMRARAAAEAARSFDWVAEAYPYDELRHIDLATPSELSFAPDSFAHFYRRSHYPGRASGSIGHLGVEILREPGYYLGRYPHGTGHGTPYLHDRQVPLIFLGAGIQAGRVAERVSIVDLAPTLGHLSGVPFPDDLDGRPLIP